MEIISVRSTLPLYLRNVITLTFTVLDNLGTIRIGSPQLVITGLLKLRSKKMPDQYNTIPLQLLS